MPDSLSGLIALVFLLTPGFLYVLADENRRLPAQRTAFNETSRVVVASIGSLVLTALAFLAWEWLAPWTVVHIDQLVEDPSRYFDAHPVRSALGALAIFIGVCAIAFSFGKWGQGLLHTVFSGPHKRQVSWNSLFKRPELEDLRAVATCYLKSGEVLRGYVETYTTDPIESLDRSLVLGPPIVFGPPSGPLQALATGYVTVSAHDLTWMHVEYADDDALTFEGFPDLDTVEFDEDLEEA